MQYSVQRCEFVSIGPFLYPKKDQIKSKWKYTSIHPDARRRGGAAQIKWRPSIFNLGTLYELRGKDGRAFVGLLMAPLDVHSFFSLCMCVCLSLGSDIVQLAPVFFYLCLALASHFKYFRRVCSVLRVCVCVCLVSCCCRCCCCCCCYFIALFGSVLLLLLLCFRLLVFPHSIIFIISNISSILHPANWIWRHLDTE